MLAQRFLQISVMFEKQLWFFETPLYQFEQELPMDVLEKLNMLNKNKSLRIHDIREMDAKEIGELIRHRGYGAVIKKCASWIPYVELEAQVKPITRTILTVYVDVRPCFTWDDRVHGRTGQIFWIWLTDLDNNHIYHAELGNMTKKMVVRGDVQRYIFTIPLLDAAHLQPQYLVHATFEYWLGSDNEISVPCDHIHLPDKHIPNTKLLDLMPLPVSALHNELYQSIYG